MENKDITKDFEFKSVDVEGEDALNVVALADKFNDWMYKTIRPYCEGSVLEIGSGIGNISQFFANNNHQITLSDIREGYCENLKEKFGDKENVKDVLLMNLTDPEFENKFSSYFESFDSIFSLNVVEHIEDDVLALKNCKKLLKKGGKLVILVPAYQSLYNQFDTELEHYRRYTKKTLNDIFQKANIPLVRSWYFNFMGIFGWWVSGKLQKNKTVPKGQMGLYNKLVPIFKIIDKIMLNQFGLSVISVGVKK